MFDPGITEVLLIFVIGLLILGPERLPRVAAQLGRWMGKARRTAHQLRMQLEREMTMNDIMRDKEEREKRKAESGDAESDDADASADSGQNADKTYPEEEDANNSGHGDAGADETPETVASDDTPPATDDSDAAQQRRA
jgi:sec-independent protein translocase protein TatB